jgi:hypothetical protein
MSNWTLGTAASATWPFPAAGVSHNWTRVQTPNTYAKYKPQFTWIPLPFFYRALNRPWKMTECFPPQSLVIPLLISDQPLSGSDMAASAVAWPRLRYEPDPKRVPRRAQEVKVYFAVRIFPVGGTGKKRHCKRKTNGKFRRLRSVLYCRLWVNFCVSDCAPV